MEQIIVGVDGSQPSREALRWAADEARLRQASLQVIMTWHTPFVGGHPYVGPAFDPSVFERDARKTLDEIIAAVDTTGIPQVDRILTFGDAAASLLTASKDADLLVVGSRGLGGFRGLLLGSVSRRCANLASTPLVVVREVAEPDAKPGRGIVVGVDGSDSSLAALRWAVEEGGHRDQPVQVLHAWHEQAFGMDPYGMAVDATPWESAARLLLDTAIADVGAASAQDSGRSVAVTPALVHGGAAGALVEASAGAALVVVGNRGHSSFALGSVSHQVLHHAHCPVALIPAG